MDGVYGGARPASSWRHKNLCARLGPNQGSGADSIRHRKELEKMWLGESWLAAVERIMGKQSLMLVLVAAVLTAKASAQEIVIEPTNGRAPTTNHGSRPDLSRPNAERPAPVEPKKLATKSAAKSADQERGAIRSKESSGKSDRGKAGDSSSGDKAFGCGGTGGASKRGCRGAPAPKKTIERRPVWAMADTRDAGSLQSEIASALARDPKLAGSEIQVSVDDGSVTLEGRAGTQEHLQAQRLAKSYAWNRKLVDHILVNHTEVPPSMAAKK